MWYRLMVNGQCMTTGPTQDRRAVIADLVRQRAFGPVVAQIDASRDLGRTWERLSDAALQPAWVRVASTVVKWWRSTCAWSRRVWKEMD